MPFLREFGNKKDELIVSGETLIKCISKLPLPYMGNKKKLLSQIHAVLLKHNIQFDTVLDAFSGSASVSLLFKMMGKKVISNDLLMCAYVKSVALIENSGT